MLGIEAHYNLGVANAIKGKLFKQSLVGSDSEDMTAQNNITRATKMINGNR